MRSPLQRFVNSGWVVLFTICLAGLFTGCGPSRPATYPVSGRVEFTNGDVVKTGIIELESVEHGTTATGRIQEDGSFVLGTFDSEDGAVAGSQRVIVIQLIMGDGTIRHTKDHGAPVPVRYASYDTSPLTAEVRAEPENQLTISLEK